MSYRIEYQWVAFHVPAQSIGMAEDRFVVAIEGGDNNLYSYSGKRARSWCVGMIGTKVQVLKSAVYFAGSCEGGGLQPYGRTCKPESYIRRIRRLIENPINPACGAWCPEIRVAPDHPVVDDLRLIGIEPVLEKYYGTMTATAIWPNSGYREFFRLVDKYGDEISAWSLASVQGLPAS